MGLLFLLRESEFTVFENEAVDTLYCILWQPFHSLAIYN